jgi:hypothetical protein
MAASHQATAPLCAAVTTLTWGEQTRRRITGHPEKRGDTSGYFAAHGRMSRSTAELGRNLPSAIS